MKKTTLVAIILLCIGVTPRIASADATDVFTCDKNGQATSGAGSTGPLGGPYVPSADYAVEQNSGLMVYKECVLRELVDSKRKAALAAVDKQVLEKLNTGNGGSGFPSRELGREESQLSDRTAENYLIPEGSNQTAFDKFNPSIATQVKSGIADGYIQERDPRNEFECGYTGDLEQAVTGVPAEDNYWAAFDALTYDPACNVFGATVIGSDALNGQVSYELYKNTLRLNWGQGVYDAAHFDKYGFRITDTPGAIVLAVGIQSIQSGYQQQRAANDIGQMVDGLYVGMSNEVLTAGTDGVPGGSNGQSGGLAGITQAVGGALSYMGQVAKNAGDGFVRDTASATIGILNSALALERQYYAAVSSSANIFTQTNRSLQDRESRCFDLITSAVCVANSASNDSRCTAVSGGGTLTIARSTVFSQRVIDTSIRTLATAVVTKLNSSTQIIASIQALITGLSANSSQASQTAALSSLNAINPHKSADVTNAQQEQQSVATLMANVLSNTSTAWGESTDPRIGWCNVNTQAVRDEWTACWSGSGSCPTQ